MKSNWRWLYAISAAAVLIGILFDLHILYLAAKPLLMIILTMYFISASKRYPAWRLYVVIALIFSWAGDVFLIRSDLFIFGLLSFLLVARVRKLPLLASAAWQKLRREDATVLSPASLPTRSSLQ